ncbi:PhnD/SsuA/transferrin family substrate-binding protein [methane-oxidizing endosymbiont of Gigantopelta aegis]|nr:PhnD/SsuA/transferrin family substrate-binding protein [methane-oxidizing endosymbiont of Gigantopelta aegis]
MGITHRDNNISSLKDLKGRSVAFGDPLSASSNLYPKWKLKRI